MSDVKVKLLDEAREYFDEDHARWGDHYADNQAQDYGKKLVEICDAQSRSLRHAHDMLKQAESELERMREALERISAIENKTTGGDWDEIDEARLIAHAALGGAA